MLKNETLLSFLSTDTDYTLDEQYVAEGADYYINQDSDPLKNHSKCTLVLSGSFDRDDYPQFSMAEGVLSGGLPRQNWPGGLTWSDDDGNVTRRMGAFAFWEPSLGLSSGTEGFIWPFCTYSASGQAIKPDYIFCMAYNASGELIDTVRYEASELGTWNTSIEQTSASVSWVDPLRDEYYKTYAYNVYDIHVPSGTRVSVVAIMHH